LRCGNPRDVDAQRHMLARARARWLSYFCAGACRINLVQKFRGGVLVFRLPLTGMKWWVYEYFSRFLVLLASSDTVFQLLTLALYAAKSHPPPQLFLCCAGTRGLP
jgi:hypothetical protein